MPNADDWVEEEELTEEGDIYSEGDIEDNDDESEEDYETETANARGKGGSAHAEEGFVVKRSKRLQV